MHTPPMSVVSLVISITVGLAGLYKIIHDLIAARRDAEQKEREHEVAESAAKLKVIKDDENTKAALENAGIANLFQAQTTQITQQATQLRSQSEQIKNQSEQIAELDKSVRDFRKEFFDEVEKRKLSDISAEAAHMRADDAETRLKVLKDKLFAIEKENLGLRTFSEEQRQQIETLKKQIDALQERLGKLDNDVHNVTNQEIKTTTVTTVTPKPAQEAS